MSSPRKQLWRATQKQSANFRRATARAFTILPPFQELLCNSSLPPMRLNPDGSWMQLLALTTAEQQSAHRGQGLDRPPLPCDALIDFQLMRVRIPVEWSIDLSPDRFIIKSKAQVPERMCAGLQANYKLHDATNYTTVRELAADIKSFLLSRKELQLQHERMSGRMLHLWIETVHNGRVTAMEELRYEDTLSKADVYNRRQRLIITCAPVTVSIGQARFNQQQGANSATSNDAERRHIPTLVNVLGDRASQRGSGVNLPLGTRDYTKLESHVKAICHRPQRICYNCMYTMYPTTDNAQVLKVPLAQLPNGKYSCRAYRVAEHFIAEQVARLGDANEEEIFLCKKTDDGSKWCVYSCPTCKHERSQQAATYNLFDGVEADGSFVTCGLGDPVDPEFACLNCDERLALSVLKMVDKTFEAYAGYGYTSYGGGGLLDVNDYSGLAALLVSNPEHEGADEAKMRAALMKLRSYGNGLVNNLLTCLEREIDRPLVDDAFPPAAGRGGIPMLSEADADVAALGPDPDERNELPIGNAVSQQAVRVLKAQRIGGVWQTVDEIDIAATHASNLPEFQSIGTVRGRTSNITTSHPAVSRERTTALDAALHTTLHPSGLDARYEMATACTSEHYNKARLGGIVPKFRHAEEFLWSRYQTAMKARFHTRSMRLVNADVAANATRAAMQANEVSLQQQRNANPALRMHIESEHTYTGGVAKNVVGGKAYWHEAFVELMAMAVQYGVPKFFATFTANEAGWSDVTAATDGVFYARRPVETTRQYHWRWTQFKTKFLCKGDSPVGEIERTWHRQEDQVWTQTPCACMS